MKTYYDAITAQIKAGLWEDCMAMFDRAWTLDFYYRLYCLVRKYEPERTYGYKQRLLSNQQLLKQLGPHFRTVDENTIKKSIATMELCCSL